MLNERFDQYPIFLLLKLKIVIPPRYNRDQFRFGYQAISNELHNTLIGDSNFSQIQVITVEQLLFKV